MMITQNILNLYTALTQILVWLMNVDLVEFKFGTLVFFFLFIYVGIWLFKMMSKRRVKR